MAIAHSCGEVTRRVYMLLNRQFWDELAIQSYLTILKKKPTESMIHNNLGLAYVRINRCNKAVRSFQRAIKHDKNFSEAYYHMGTTLQKLGKRKEAIRAFNNYSKYARCGDRSSRVVSDLVDELKGQE
jgi:predicted Zn-dependent protease